MTTMPAKVWLRFFLLGYFVLMLLWAVSLTSPVPYGDLTRIGRLSEREFGWREPPPKVEPAPPPPSELPPRRRRWW